MPIQAALRTCDAKFLFCQHTPNLELDSCQILPIDEVKKQIGFFSPIKVPVNISDNQPAYILFTSGTSGDPKGVILEHQSLYETINFLGSSRFAIS